MMKMEEYIKKIVYSKISLIILLIFSTLPKVSGFSGGEIIDANEYSYMVQIVLYRYNGNKLHFKNFVCGGALLAPNIVITAGHCIEENESAEYMVYAGLTQLAKSDTKGGIKVDEIVLHHDGFQYKDDGKTKGKGGHDIALLKLKEHFKNKAVLHLTTNYQFDPPPTYFITGYGCENEIKECDQHKFTSLKKKYLNMVQECPDGIIDQYKALKKKGMICFATNEKEPGFGNGDSGSPIVVESGEKCYIIGILSKGQKCNANTPCIVTNVRYYADDWIEEVMAEISQP